MAALWRFFYDREDDTWCQRKWVCEHCWNWNTYGMTPYCPYCGGEMGGRGEDIHSRAELDELMKEAGHEV